MRTIVYQSYRTFNVPEWITTCMESVRHWATLKGFDYAFYDDRFFDRVPPDIRVRIEDQKCILADYARLHAARELLARKYDRAIWVDADTLVFDPLNFEIPIETGHAFCREVWLHRTFLGTPQFKLTLNNTICVFCRDQQFLDFYIDTARRILTAPPPIDTFAIGPDFLVALRRALPIPLLTNAGIIGPEMALHYLRDNPRFLRPYLAYQTSPIAAANLCLSKFTQLGPSATKLIDDVVERLLSDNGASLNRHFTAPYTPATAHEFLQPLSPFLAAKETFLAIRHYLKTQFHNPLQKKCRVAQRPPEPATIAPTPQKKRPTTAPHPEHAIH